MEALRLWSQWSWSRLLFSRWAGLRCVRDAFGPCRCGGRVAEVVQRRPTAEPSLQRLLMPCRAAERRRSGRPSKPKSFAGPRGKHRPTSRNGPLPTVGPPLEITTHTDASHANQTSNGTAIPADRPLPLRGLRSRATSDTLWSRSLVGTHHDCCQRSRAGAFRRLHAPYVISL